MSFKIAKSFLLTEPINNYLWEKGFKVHPVLMKCMETTHSLLANVSMMQISPEQFEFFRLIIKMTGAKKGIEIGTFTGASSLAFGLALPEDGKLICCDINDEYTKYAEQFWAEAGITNKMELLLGPALESLEKIKAKNEGPYDFAFIDADKGNYINYYEKILELLKPGGFLFIDNTLWSGNITDQNDKSPGTLGLRAINDKVASDPRVEFVLLPMADGITMVRKI